MRVKICFFNINAYSVFNAKSGASIGGTEVQLFNAAKFLARIDNLEVSFIVGDWDQDNVEQYENISLHKSFSIRRSLFSYLKAPFQLWRSLGRVNADVYIASSAGVEIGIIALFCKLQKRKFIYRTAHDIDCSGEYSKRGIKGWAYTFGLRKADLVFTQKRENQMMLREYYGIDAVVVRNAYSIKASDDHGKGQYVLWISRCEKWKNPELFIEVANSLKHLHFVMICQKSMSEYYKSVKKSAEKLSNIDFIEGIPFDEIQKYYNRARIFVGTSDYEGFPNTFMQACIGKTPIISFRVNPEEFITKYNLGYCANGDFDRMVRCIDTLMNNEADWNEKSENALGYVRENHDIEVIGKQWEREIYSVVKK
jgi:glycosyltransferase involved in cell wall biosynthesis